MDETVTPTQEPSVPANKRMLLVVVAIAAVALIAAGYFWWRASQGSDPQEAARREAQTLIARVSQLIVLPEDEEPVIATVADPEQLKAQPFFAKAQKGDKVLIFNNARKAVLYNPTEHRIVEVAPLNIGEPSE